MLRGRPRLITGTNPAAGVEISETVPSGVSWKILTVMIHLVADATVANRILEVRFDDASTTDVWRYQHTSPITASQDRILLQGRSLGAQMTGGNNNVILIPLPALVLPAGFRIRTITANLQAGDDYAAPVFFVEERTDP